MNVWILEKRSKHGTDYEIIEESVAKKLDIEKISSSWIEEQAKEGGYEISEIDEDHDGRYYAQWYQVFDPIAVPIWTDLKNAKKVLEELKDE